MATVPTKPTRWETVTAALDDESIAELRQAVADHTNTVTAIAEAIHSLTGIEVSVTTIRGWRRGERLT